MSDQRDNPVEKELQEKWGELRSDKFLTYRNTLAYFCSVSCVEEAKGPAILDLACGNGRTLDLVKKHLTRVVACDASAFQLAEAKRRHPEVEFHESLIEDLFLDERFDSVLLQNVLEHVRNPVEVLTKAATFLKDDGLLLAYVPNAEAINRRISLMMGSLKELEELSPYDLAITGHRRYYRMETLAKDITAAGLTIIKEGGVLFKQLSTVQMDWFLANGPWNEGGLGWGRVGEEKEKDWRAEFCRSCYEIGRQYPRECNVIFIVARK
jgi:2-polyprenyl-3-methyl-5-hydroxy-6-metoxy-1,4-benzoquinol methylase